MRPEPSEAALDDPGDPGQARDLESPLPSFDDLPSPTIVAHDLTGGLGPLFPSMFPGIRTVIADAGHESRKLAEQKGSCPSVGGVGRFDSAGDRQAQCIDQDVGLAPFYSFMRIEATDTSTFRRLYRLPVHDHHRGTGRPAGFPAPEPIDFSLQASPYAGVLPRAETVIHGAPGWKLPRKKAPLTAGAQQIENSVDHNTHIGCVQGRPPGNAFGKSGASSAPNCIAHVCRVEIVCHCPFSRNQAKEASLLIRKTTPQLIGRKNNYRAKPPFATPAIILYSSRLSRSRIFANFTSAPYLRVRRG